MIIFVRNEYVSVAQLDRASDYGSEGRVFESCHSQMKAYIERYALFFFIGIKKPEAPKDTSGFLHKEKAAKLPPLFSWVSV